MSVSNKTFILFPSPAIEAADMNGAVRPGAKGRDADAIRKFLLFKA